MSHIYIALVDTPGFFAALIRRYVKQRYIHVVISEEPTFKEAYSVGRRNPAIPIFAGFTKESRDEILHTFPSAFYRICELDCTYAQKKAIMERLKKDYNKRMRLLNEFHYSMSFSPPHKIKDFSYSLRITMIYINSSVYWCCVDPTPNLQRRILYGKSINFQRLDSTFAHAAPVRILQ